MTKSPIDRRWCVINVPAHKKWTGFRLNWRTHIGAQCKMWSNGGMYLAWRKGSHDQALSPDCHPVPPAVQIISPISRRTLWQMLVIMFRWKMIRSTCLCCEQDSSKGRQPSRTGGSLTKSSSWWKLWSFLLNLRRRCVITLLYCRHDV